MKPTPIISKIMNILRRHGLEIKRMRGDHIIIINKKEPPKLKRPIVLVNEKRLSNVVRLNLLKECEKIGIKKKEFERVF